jgi:N-acetyl-anhydromuramyl-L-alanine amidase AmpD
MGAVTGLLALGDRSAFPGFQAVRTARLEPIPAARGVSAPTGARGVSVTSTGAQRDPILRIDRPLDRSRWRSIVIHDSGEPAGDAESIRRLHLSHGYRMMGYHFLIGNGNGLGDGVVHVGERWIRQVPGWHAVGPDAQWHNNHSIAICLVGNGDRRPMTGRQITQLVSLISRLQRELDIPAGAVHLHRDIARGLTTSPGAFFAADELEQGLLATVR